MKKISIIIFLVGFFLVGNGCEREGFFISTTSSESLNSIKNSSDIITAEPLVTTSVAINTQKNNGWKNIVDKQNEYELEYPDFLEKSEGAELYPWYSPAVQDWKFPAFWIKDTNLSLAGIILQVLPNLNEQECLKEYNLFQKNFEQDKKEKININGIDWYYTKTQFVTLGKVHERINYEVLKNNRCYHLSLYLDSKNISTLDLKGIKEFNREQYILVFKKIVTSFNILPN